MLEHHQYQSGLLDITPMKKPQSGIIFGISMLTIVCSLSASAQANQPICYARLAKSGNVTNLNKLCGATQRNSGNVIDLSIDADRDGVSDQLLALTQLYTQEERAGKSSQDREAAFRRLTDRLPYSNSVRKLMTQLRPFRDQLLSGLDRSQDPSAELVRQYNAIEQRIFKDPNYIKIQAEQDKVSRKLESLRS
jgi:hypothetical protein